MPTACLATLCLYLQTDPHVNCSHRLQLCGQLTTLLYRRLYHATTPEFPLVSLVLLLISSRPVTLASSSLISVHSQSSYLCFVGSNIHTCHCCLSPPVCPSPMHLPLPSHLHTCVICVFSPSTSTDFHV